ncbi:unnamed protein product (macronuclear) [Paramecium tetraurelia]|uniref:Receptor ligand binding region domain-containing protein n=1 Tax=Paramecium tetraurelia TaxID=5888 RepID=A0CUB6_PARTE|nr:uncharacterized protein GSPATT00010583001 [Paramecium tetraurelia]CAK74383.1 unnamed protein product [Paramecium tetraurelia]|eukprot:XP_001441780.1 hypothetical protein (macronuclear) [Paramecium tetraurelia strain d4-2]
MFIIAYALQLNIYLGKIQDPLILPNHTGMLVDIFQDVIDSFKTRRNEQVDLLYVDQPDQANITFNFIRNYNQEKSIVLTQDAIQLDYSQYDVFPMSYASSCQNQYLQKIIFLFIPVLSLHFSLGLYGNSFSITSSLFSLGL